MSEDGPSWQAGEFFALARALRAFKVGPVGGHPSDRALAEAAGVSATTIGEWLRGSRFPQDAGKILTVVRMVRDAAARRGIASPAGLLDEACWRQAWRAEAGRRAGAISAAVQGAQAARALAPPSAGWPLAEVRDPFALEVHRPVQPEDAPGGLPELPAYVPRGHDQVLAQVVRAAAGGRSGIAVLVGGSSTGKTRACWEALHLLRNQDAPWRLWHPIDPTRPDAALAELPGIGPRTVVWLNEAQFYLDTVEADPGERVAAGLRELLRHPARAPVLVLASMWPQYWDTLTACPLGGGADPHAQARELLAGHDIPVPTAFTAEQMGQLSRAGDARLVLAAEAAADGEVAQFLAGAPELLARYRNAPPAARALIHTAMDARLLGLGAGLPYAFLEAAAPGYLTEGQWDALGEDWLEQALAYAAVPAKGARGPLTRIRPRARAARSGSRDSGAQPTASPGGVMGGPLYRLADYLDQHGRQHREGQIPPPEFWAAAAAHARPADQAELGDAAHYCGLYRAAAQLHKNAAASGSLRSVLYFIGPPDCLRADPRPAHWAASHVSLDDPDGVARLLDGLRAAGAAEQVAALLARDPAAHVSLDNPVGVARLLDGLRATGADGQAAALASRAAAHVSLDNPVGVAMLLGGLRAAGAAEQVAALASRAAAHVSLDDPRGVAMLLGGLRAAGADGQAAALLARDPAAHAPLDEPRGVAFLLGGLRAAGAAEQAAALLARDPAGHVSLDNPDGVAMLLGGLRAAGAAEQVAALASRAAAHVSLGDPVGVARLLGGLRAAGADGQAAALLARDPAGHVSLDNPGGVAMLLGGLQAAGAAEQAAALASRAAAHAPLGDPGGVARLLGWLRAAGADGQAAALLARDPAGHVSLDDPGGVAFLLGGLRAAGADGQAAALLARDPAGHVSLDDPGGVAMLLGGLRAAGAAEQAAALASRAAAHAPLGDPGGVARLLGGLRAAGADGQAAALVSRLPGAGIFSLFLEQRDGRHRFRFGREADGSPSGPWSWDDLD